MNVMALKPVTIRLDEEEYENLKDYLDKFGDPDINMTARKHNYSSMPILKEEELDSWRQKVFGNKRKLSL